MSSTSDIRSNVTRLLDDIGITPRGVQIQAIDAGLLEGQSIMITSPTGSGKTLVGEMALLRAIIEGKRGLYLVPLRALAYQVARNLRTRYQDKAVRIGVTTGDLHLTGDEMADFDIVVTTYERADSLLRHQVAWLPEVGTVVVDEVQSLSDSRRGARLESVILRMKRSLEDVQLVVLSATIKHPDDLAAWLGCTLVESRERPVPLANKIFTTSDRSLAVQRTTMAVVQSNGQVLVFHRTRREAEAEADRLADDVGRQLSILDKRNLDIELESLENTAIRITGSLRRALHQGVAFHHAGIASNVRGLIESLFRRGLIRVICATTTLASGMDLPARTVVLTNVKSPEDYTQWLSANAVHQMLGRAGRPGYDSKGFGVILAGSRGEAEEIQRRYFESIDSEGDQTLVPVYDRIQSKLGTSSSMTEQVLVVLDLLNEATPEEIEDFLTDSFLVFSGTRYARSPTRLINIDSASAETAIELHALQDTIRASRQGVLGKASIRDSNQEVLGGIVSGFQGGYFTCRFSARLGPSGVIEGPSCSCGNPIDGDGILCVHLVSLGMMASGDKNTQALADYVIPISLEEVSPLKKLIRMELAEGGTDGAIRITRLGRSVNRLYLSAPSVREILARLHCTEDSVGLMALLRHIVSLESGSNLDESFEHFVGEVATTASPLQEIAEHSGIALGDAHGLLDRTRWLLFAISVLAENGGMQKLKQLCDDLLRAIDSRYDERRLIDGSD